MKKFVLRLDLQEDKEDKRRALKAASAVSGIDEIAIDMKSKTLTVIGTVDPVSVVVKLRKKNLPAGILSLGTIKAPEKKQEKEQKDEPKEEQPVKEEPKKEEEEPKEEGKPVKDDEENESESDEMVERLMQYYPPMNPHFYEHHYVKEEPNACVIC